MAAPERALLPVEGFSTLTESYSLFLPAALSAARATDADDANDGAAADGAADTTVVLFPGNPGIAGCYSLLLQRLRDEWRSSGPLRAGGSTRFVAVSYAGHVHVGPAERAAAAAAAAEAAAAAAAAAGGDTSGSSGGNPGAAKKSSNNNGDKDSAEDTTHDKSDGGGSGGGGGGGVRYSLERQVEHKAQFLRQHVLPRTRGALVLVGHSIGAHMAVEVALSMQEEQEEREASPRARARAGSPEAAAAAPPPPAPAPPPPTLRVATVLLTPFLSTNPPCPRQRAVRRLSGLHAYAGWAAALAGRLLAALPLPERAHLGLAAWASGADHAQACQAVRGLLRPGVVDSALFLAKCEFERLPQGVSGLPLLEIEALGEALLVGGPDDMWWPESHHRAVESRFAAAAAAGSGSGSGPGGGEALSAVWDPRVSHLFGCVAHETVAVAAHVARWWAARVAAGGGGP